jgi:osmoprotectant transport system permease protein
MSPHESSQTNGKGTDVLRWLGLLALVVMTARGEPVVLGSKEFTESIILSEIATQLLRSEGIAANHRRELGGTRILWSALQRGDIDAYPDYTGTVLAELLGARLDSSREELERLLETHGIRASPPLGFNNTYVLGMQRDRARALQVDRVSQLRAHPELRYGFSNEFLQRADGWPGLRDHYQLQVTDVRGLSHVLAYRGLESGALDVIDLYSTDAEIRYYDIQPLLDDAGYFPRYEAIFLYRADAPLELQSALAQLGGRIDEPTMIAMNARAKLERVPETQVAANYLRERFAIDHEPTQATRSQRIARRTLEHLGMVSTSLAAAVVLAIPLGVLAFRRPRLGAWLLGAASVLQTLPALALLVLLIPWLGVGYLPAVAALFIYSLLPILRNTHAGLATIAPDVRESAIAIGLPYRARLLKIELPLAMPAIMAGIKTAAVINVGTATLGALIGAGGYGQPMLTGIRLDDTALILEGAVPAALLALAVQGIFTLIERRMTR